METEQKQVGTVKWFNDNKGYGFVQGLDGSDFFVHYSAIQMSGRRTLETGQSVEFETAFDKDRPGPKAVNVTVLN